MPDTIINVHTFDQPIETGVKVGMEIDSKGQKKPNVEIRISRKIDKENADKFYGTIMDDLQLALSRCKDTIQKAMEV